MSENNMLSEAVMVLEVQTPSAFNRGSYVSRFETWRAAEERVAGKTGVFTVDDAPTYRPDLDCWVIEAKLVFN